jgi:uncharacterized protein YjbI with pentapeptide repeats
MTANDKKYPASINADIFDKADASNRRNLGRGWKPVEISAAEFEDAVSLGWAISAQFENEYRKTANLIRAGFLAADVDGGLTLQDAQHHAFVQHHAAFIHTTASHTEARHRFRIVFLLERAILTAADWADALLGLALRLGSDLSATDAARLFYGNSMAQFSASARPWRRASWPN